MSASRTRAAMADATGPCLACGGTTTMVLDRVFDTRFGIDRLFGIARCSACGLEQTVPRLPLDELGGYYAAHYNFGGESGTTYTGLRARFLNSALYRLWLKIDGDISFHGRRGRGRLIDIG